MRNEPIRCRPDDQYETCPFADSCRGERGGIAAVCYFLAGVIADAASASPIIGVTFKTTGSIAGFLISFSALFLAYQKMRVTSLAMIVRMRPKRGNFARDGNPFAARITIIKEVTGKQVDRDSAVIWEAATLNVLLRDIEEDDLVMITLADAHGTQWQRDFFSPLLSEVILS